MEESKEVQTEILLKILEELQRLNDLKEVELGIKSEVEYKTKQGLKKVRRK